MKIDISLRLDMTPISDAEIGLLVSMIDEIFEEMSKLDDAHSAAILPNQEYGIQCPE